MEAWEAVRGMMEASGVGPSELSRRLGHSRSYITASMAQGSVPRLDTFARIAHDRGYRLVLENKDGSRGVELYSEVDERQEDSWPVRDLAYDLAEKAAGKEAMEKMAPDTWEDQIQAFVPEAMDAIRRREGMFFEDGDHRDDAYDTLMTDIFSPWW
jgi:DNA-binding phage protein